MRKIPPLALLTLCALACGFSPAQDGTDRDLAGNPYRPAGAVEGDLKIIGSRTMASLLEQWGQGLRRHQPKIQVELDCEGSETALANLTGDKTTLAALTRLPTQEELKAAESKAGRELLALPVCRYELVLVTHKDNPLDAVSLVQARNCFFQTAPQDTPLTWALLGATGDTAKAPVQPVGRDSASGTRHALRALLDVPADAKERKIQDYPSFRELTQAVAKDKNALGYCARRIAHKNEVKILKLLAENGSEIPALSQPICLVVAKEKDKPLPPAALEFLAFALSQSGQTMVSRDNFQPLPPAEVHAGLDKLGFSPIK